ncbi:hypothetical protein [Streptosporangium vulgare]|uniref:Uncharacterized protein n=1 Tax=Streptosporangium vulgare TaxID=46190 RepID=A0ABV5TT29_9ACTN
MPEIPEPEVRVTRYEVSCLPEDDLNAPAYTLAVESRGGGEWVVKSSGACLNADGVKSWGHHWEDGREPVTDEEFAAHEVSRQAWLAAHRFDEETALAVARKFAPTMTCMGHTVADALRDRETPDA